VVAFRFTVVVAPEGAVDDRELIAPFAPASNAFIALDMVVAAPLTALAIFVIAD
jgi:hypothetical protein